MALGSLDICETGLLRETKTCRGITKKGDSCKLIVKKEPLKEGCHKLNNLARGPFVLSTLDSQLSDLVSFFLCKQWDRERQHNDVKQRRFDAAVRNQADVQESSRSVFHKLSRKKSTDRNRNQPALPWSQMSLLPYGVLARLSQGFCLHMARGISASWSGCHTRHAHNESRAPGCFTG
jgi:hypothetical protein